MSNIRRRSEEIRNFVLDNVEKYPADIATKTGLQFSITRQAVNKHLLRMVEEDCLSVEGKTKSRVYKLKPETAVQFLVELEKGIEEDVVWRERLLPLFGKLPDNIRDIWHFSFTEMFNNAIDHSDGTTVLLRLEQDSRGTRMWIVDNGVGIFKKIQRELNLLHEREAVLELAKGKFTTDPARHSGQGIFFTSRMVDEFYIISGEVIFTHSQLAPDDWVIENDNPSERRTSVVMKLNNHTARQINSVFNEYSTDGDFGFTKTVVPVRLAQHGDEMLVSRSQAKRVITRFEKFKVILLDFKEVKFIGQAFADEIFRVFANSFPEIELKTINESEDVKNMIKRARVESNP